MKRITLADMRTARANALALASQLSARGYGRAGERLLAIVDTVTQTPTDRGVAVSRAVTDCACGDMHTVDERRAIRDSVLVLDMGGRVDVGDERFDALPVAHGGPGMTISIPLDR